MRHRGGCPSVGYGQGERARGEKGRGEEERAKRLHIGIRYALNMAWVGYTEYLSMQDVRCCPDTQGV